MTRAWFVTRSPAIYALFAAGCATPASSLQPLSGTWGGPHVGIVFGADQGRIEYDCAAGTIREPVEPGAGGEFEARGTHTPGHGGPERIGFTPPSFPARYSGRVRGDTMTLLVEVPAITARIGPYTLRRGTEPMLTRCL